MASARPRLMGIGGQWLMGRRGLVGGVWWGWLTSTEGDGVLMRGLRMECFLYPKLGGGKEVEEVLIGESR